MSQLTVQLITSFNICSGNCLSFIVMFDHNSRPPPITNSVIEALCFLDLLKSIAQSIKHG